MSSKDSFFFTKSTRPPLEKTDLLPGPNYYNPSLGNKKKSPAYTMSYTMNEIHSPSFDNPGPASYEFVIKKPHIPSINIKKSSKFKSFFLDGFQHELGPGSYNPCDISDLSKQVSFSKSPRPTLEIMANTPGPGAYLSFDLFKTQIIENDRKKQKKTQIKIKKNSIQTSPPVTYVENNEFIPQSPRFSFSQSPRFFDKKNLSISPGPSKYALHKNNFIHGPKFGNSNRPDLNKTDSYPGPDAYDIKIQKKNNSPKFGQPKSPNNYVLPNSSEPGPGQYDIQFNAVYLSKIQNRGFGKAKKLPSIKNLTPGVGFYSIDDSKLQPDLSPKFPKAKK